MRLPVSSLHCLDRWLSRRKTVIFRIFNVLAFLQILVAEQLFVLFCDSADVVNVTNLGMICGSVSNSTLQRHQVLCRSVNHFIGVNMKTIQLYQRTVLDSGKDKAQRRLNASRVSCRSTCCPTELLCSILGFSCG